MLKQCPISNHVTLLDYDFCHEHGERLIGTEKCLGCGNYELFLEDKFCASCGKPNPFHLCQVCEQEYADQKGIFDDLEQWVGLNCLEGAKKQ